jgi:hypothetical protein
MVGTCRTFGNKISGIPYIIKIGRSAVALTCTKRDQSCFPLKAFYVLNGL